MSFLIGPLADLYEEQNNECKNSFQGQDTIGGDFLLFDKYETNCDGRVNAGVCCNNKAQGMCGTKGIDIDPRCKSKKTVRHLDKIFQNACPPGLKLNTGNMNWTGITDPITNQDGSCRGDLGGRCVDLNSTVDSGQTCIKINT
jgi:hypothetical protein